MAPFTFYFKEKIPNLKQGSLGLFIRRNTLLLQQKRTIIAAE